MATLTVSYCRPVQVIDQMTGPAVEAITVGQWVRIDPSTGKIALGNATTEAEAAQGGIALHAAAAGEAVTVLRQGLVDIGDAMSSMNYGALVYLSDTDGTLADATGTTTKVVGEVASAWGSTTADKLLRVQQAEVFTPAGE